MTRHQCGSACELIFVHERAHGLLEGPRPLCRRTQVRRASRLREPRKGSSPRRSAPSESGAARAIATISSSGEEDSESDDNLSSRLDCCFDDNLADRPRRGIVHHPARRMHVVGPEDREHARRHDHGIPAGLEEGHVTRGVVRLAHSRAGKLGDAHPLRTRHHALHVDVFRCASQTHWSAARVVHS